MPCSTVGMASVYQEVEDVMAIVTAPMETTRTTAVSLNFLSMHVYIWMHSDCIQSVPLVSFNASTMNASAQLENVMDTKTATIMRTSSIVQVSNTIYVCACVVSVCVHINCIHVYINLLCTEEDVIPVASPVFIVIMFGYYVPPGYTSIYCTKNSLLTVFTHEQYTIH